MVPTAKTALQNGLNWSGHGPDVFATTYESNVLYTLRYMVDNGIAGGQWLQLRAPSYSLRRPTERTTHCQ
jgi:DNA polymerase delta subunit 1